MEVGNTNHRKVGKHTEFRKGGGAAWQGDFDIPASPLCGGIGLDGSTLKHSGGSGASDAATLKHESGSGASDAASLKHSSGSGTSDPATFKHESGNGARDAATLKHEGGSGTSDPANAPLGIRNCVVLSGFPHLPVAIRSGWGLFSRLGILHFKKISESGGGGGSSKSGGGGVQESNENEEERYKGIGEVQRDEDGYYIYTNGVEPDQELKYPTADDNYTGEVRKTAKGNLVPDGSGRCEFGAGKDDGCVYEGEWVMGVRTGFGRMSYPNGDRISVDFTNDVLDGEALIRFSPNSTFWGFFKDGVQVGKGQFKVTEGNRITYVDVAFKDGKIMDTVEFRWGDKSVYKGGFKVRSSKWKRYIRIPDVMNGKYEGKGVLTDENGVIVHDGLWVNGKPKKE